MTRHSHLIIAGITAYAFNLPVLPALFVANLPDVDLKWQGKIKAGKLLNNHRGITHHALFFPVLTVVFFITDNQAVKSMALGYLSHLLADIMTISGIPYWKYKNRLSLKLFSTGSISEALFVIGLLACVILVGKTTCPFLLTFICLKVQY